MTMNCFMGIDYRRVEVSISNIIILQTNKKNSMKSRKMIKKMLYLISLMNTTKDKILKLEFQRQKIKS